MYPPPLSAVEPCIRNPILEGADPWVIRYGDEYLWCFADGNRGVALHLGPNLHTPGVKRVVWTSPEAGPASRELWAPEIHHIGGRWHIYFAASDGDNRNHRAHVLVGEADDPFGPYELKGPLYTGDDRRLTDGNRWSIDFTIHEHAGRLYGFWSGWEAEEDVQHLYAAPMADPTTVSGPRVRLSDNAVYEWERVEPGGRGLNEAPQPISHEGRLHLLFSASASWLPSYCVGRMELHGDDPLDASAWVKHPVPLLSGSERLPGVGHATAVPSPDGFQHWLVYHAKLNADPGWTRVVAIQPFSWHRGRPVVGAPASAVPCPRGSVSPEGRPERTVDLSRPVADMHFLGHHQLLEFADDGVRLGRTPSQPANLFRSGEKLLLTGPAPSDLSLVVEFTTAADQRDVGVLFRTTEPTIGYDAQRGYFAGVIPEDGRLLIGCTDGSTWRELASTHLAAVPDGRYRLEVTAVGDRLQARVGDTTVEAWDGTHQTGMVGLRVVDAEAVFQRLQYRPASP